MAAKGISHNNHIVKLHGSDKLFHKFSQSLQAGIFYWHLIDGKHGYEYAKLGREAINHPFPVTQSSKKTMKQHQHLSLTFVYEFKSILFLHIKGHKRLI